MARLIRYLWAAPTTLLVGGPFVILALATGGCIQRVAGCLEVFGGGVTWLLRRVPIKNGAAAMTLGHVILGRDRLALDRSRRHEHVHVRQCERWGPLFIPVYLAIAAWLLVRQRDPYWDHPFEMEAYAIDTSRDG